MREDVAKAICKKYGIAQEELGLAFARYCAAHPDDTGDLLQTWSEQLIGVVDSNVGNLKTLTRYITAGADPAARKTRTLRLINWNDLFPKAGWLELAKKNLITAEECEQLINEILDTGRHRQRPFKKYCKKEGAVDRVCKMWLRARKDGPFGAAVYEVVNYCDRHGIPVDELNERTVLDLYRLKDLAPADSKFGGFGDWGPGDNGDPQKNKEMHFIKHVLDHHPESELAWKAECAIWWQTLNIKLTSARAKSLLGDVLYAKVAALFTGADVALAHDKVTDFLGILRTQAAWKEALETHLTDSYGLDYTAKATDMSRALTSVAVHVGDSGVYLSGVNGRFFIVGRMEGTDLGISSCYVAEDVNAKLGGRRIVWNTA